MGTHRRDHTGFLVACAYSALVANHLGLLKILDSARSYRRVVLCKGLRFARTLSSLAASRVVQARGRSATETNWHVYHKYELEIPKDCARCFAVARAITEIAC